MQWHDVTIPMHPEMIVWPGDPPFCLEAGHRIAEGGSCNTSRVSFSTHTGTHCDAPWHFEDEGKRLHEVDPAVFFGRARLIALPDVETITAADLPPEPLPPRLLIQTKNSAFAATAPFRSDFVALEEGAAQRLVDDGVRMVAIDYLSIAPWGRSGPPHHVLLQNEVFVVEGVRLAGFAPGDYEFAVLPLALLDADGAPCRAFLGTA